MVSLDDGLRRVAELAAKEQWLAIQVTTRADGTPASALVNAGIIDHPVTGARVLAVVSQGGTAKLRRLRKRPWTSLVFRSGWDWVAVSGPTELAGPDDELPGFDPVRLPQLLRDIYHAAGGHHPDLDEYDRVMVADRRAAVLVTPERFSQSAG